MIVEVFEFVRHAVGGHVHVLEGVDANRQVARCGRLGRPHVDGFVQTSEFEHDDVCFQCWACLPHDVRARLYNYLLGVGS